MREIVLKALTKERDYCKRCSDLCTTETGQNLFDYKVLCLTAAINAIESGERIPGI